MSVLDAIFRKPDPQQQQQQQPAQQGSQHAQNNPTVPNAKNSPEINPPSDTPDAKSPNAEFADLWKMEPTQQGQEPNFKLNPEQLSQVTSKLDFAKSVSQEDLAKITQGGPEAVQALINVMNTFGRNVFATNAQFASGLTESGYRMAQESINTGLPTLVQRQFAQNELFSSNSKLRDPALKPLVMAIQSQITQRYPNATPSEVNTMVEKYFNETVGSAFRKEDPQQQTTNQQQGGGNFDFSSFLG